MVSTYSRRVACLLLSALLALLPVLGVRTAWADPVDPGSVTATLAPGDSLTVTKVVHTPVIPPRPDVIFLADTTGSMGPAIANVKANATSIMNTVRLAQADSQFGAANYKDFNCSIDPVPYTLNQAITASIADAQLGIDAWSTTPGGGCDTPEAQLNALYQLATDPATGWRAGSTRIIAWFGDSSGHDPSNGHTLAAVIAALNAENIRVIAVPVDTAPDGDGLDSTGQATAITTATGGVLEPTSTTSDQVAAAILSGLQNLPTTVSWSLGTCDPNLSVSLTPASQTVTSGMDATFVETIVVSLSAPQGTTIHCDVNFLLDGHTVEGFTESIHINVPDVTAPTAECQPTTNPAGNTIPKAGNNPKSGQNPDGFYILSATDNVDPNPQIFVADTGSSFVAGPYASGTKIKLVQAPDVTPNAKPGAGVIAWIIQLKGDAVVYAVDASGNQSASVSCLVPPPPK